MVQFEVTKFILTQCSSQQLKQVLTAYVTWYSQNGFLRWLNLRKFFFSSPFNNFNIFKQSSTVACFGLLLFLNLARNSGVCISNPICFTLSRELSDKMLARIFHSVYSTSNFRQSMMDCFEKQTKKCEKICYQNSFEMLFEFNQTETKSWRLINL